MSFYLFAWIASLFFAFEAIVGKLTSKYSLKNPWLFNFIWAFLILLLSLPIALYHHPAMPKVWWPLILASLFYTLGGTLYLLGIYYLDISTFTPLFNFRSVFAVILSALFLKEILAPYQYFSIAVIFLAGMFVTMDESFSLTSFFRWPVLIIIADTIGLAFEGIFIQKSVAVNGFWTTILGVGIIMQLFLLSTIPLFIKDIKTFSLKQIPPVFFMAVTGLVGTLAANKAYASNVGISSTIIGLPLSMVMVFLFSIFAPKLLEKHSNKVYLIRFLAAGIMFLAAIRLSF